MIRRKASRTGAPRSFHAIWESFLGTRRRTPDSTHGNSACEERDGGDGKEVTSSRKTPRQRMTMMSTELQCSTVLGWPKKKARMWREFFRQVEADVVSCSRNKVHQLWEPLLAHPCRNIFRMKRSNKRAMAPIDQRAPSLDSIFPSKSVNGGRHQPNLNVKLCSADRLLHSALPLSLSLPVHTHSIRWKIEKKC